MIRPDPTVIWTSWWTCPPRTGLLERISLKQALEDTLHCLVDLIRRRNL